MPNVALPTIDYETYSEAGYYVDPATGKVKGVGTQGKGGLPEVGLPAYAGHHSAEVLTMSYDLLDGRGVRRWRPGLPNPVDLWDYVSGRGGHIAGWNVTFEWYIWNLVCVRKYGWPPLQLDQCHCDMAKSRRHSLPGSLDLAAKVLGAAPKDKRGKQLIGKLTRPQSPTKKRLGYRWTRDTAPEDFNEFDEYCDQDVVSEMSASAKIPDLTDSERATWLADQYVNARGVQVDIEALDAALDILRQTEQHFTGILHSITGGQVSTVNAVGQFISWLATQGVYTDSIKAEIVTDLLDSDIPPLARQALEIRQALGGANIKKLRKLKLQVSSDGRLRDQYTFCGADRTGRWSAGGVQLQNITAKGPKSKTCQHCGLTVGVDCKVPVVGGDAGDCPACGATDWKRDPEWTVEAVEFAIADIKRRDLKHILDVWGDPCALLAGCLRGLFIAADGKTLICSDFSAIEAVVLACLSQCQWRIEVFNTHGKIYEMSASKITGVPFEEFAAYKKANGMHHPLRKSIGKVAELASGYAGWIGAWKAFGAEEHFDSDEEIKKQILAWREASPEIVEFWGGQHRQIGAKPWDSVPQLFGLEGAAVAAIQNPGNCYAVGGISYGVANNILYCRLPSGRFLHYHRPRLHAEEDHFRRPSHSITFEGYNSNSQKGPVGWHRMDTYGGRLAENVVQAVSADIQAEALKRVEAAGYPVVMHTHDELTAEVPLDSPDHSLAHMTEVMSIRPDWASWWPIRGAGWTHKRYQKD
jgi:DNA polymerase